MGDVRIFGNEIQSLSGLSCLEKVSAPLYIEQTSLESLYGLKFLTDVGDDLVITHNPDLSTLKESTVSIR